jgi:hypothetical protein
VNNDGKTVVAGCCEVGMWILPRSALKVSNSLSKLI